MEVGEGIKKNTSNWDFEDISLDDFETHISKSVPCYELTHNLGLEISDFFCKANNVFDIGSTSGSFIHSLYERHKNKKLILAE